MGIVLQFDEVPVAWQRSADRAQREKRCLHPSLVIAPHLVECRKCGKQWKDYLKQAEIAHEAQQEAR